MILLNLWYFLNNLKGRFSQVLDYFTRTDVLGRRRIRSRTAPERQQRGQGSKKKFWMKEKPATLRRDWNNLRTCRRATKILPPSLDNFSGSWENWCRCWKNQQLTNFATLLLSFIIPTKRKTLKIFSGRKLMVTRWPQENKEAKVFRYPGNIKKFSSNSANSTVTHYFVFYCFFFICIIVSKLCCPPSLLVLWPQIYINIWIYVRADHLLPLNLLFEKSKLKNTFLRSKFFRRVSSETWQMLRNTEPSTERRCLQVHLIDTWLDRTWQFSRKIKTSALPEGEEEPLAALESSCSY